MTSTNDGKDVKSNQTSGPRGKTYYIELYKSLDSRLSGECPLRERTGHLGEAWRRVHSLCQHSAPSTHPHLLSWLQRHTAKTVLQTEWQSPTSKDEHTTLEEAIDTFINESQTAITFRNGLSPAWESQLMQRAIWFKKILSNPWGHPVLRVLLDPTGKPPSDDEILEWLKEERGVMFVTRLRQLAASKCNDLAMRLATAVMGRARTDTPLLLDAEQCEEPKDKPPENSEPTFTDILKTEAGFTVDVWELLTDIEFVLLYKDKHSSCIDLAKQTPLRNGYQLVERLQSRLETSPREKKLWKNAKEVAALITQVIITRCMVVPLCTSVSRSALYCCTRSLVRLVPAAALPAAAAKLAAPAATARHLHTLAAAVDAQSTEDMKPFVCELYVRAITAGMNELEKLKITAQKESEARLAEQTLSAWFTQLGGLLAASDRIKCECTLTAFSVHPSPGMYEKIKTAPLLPPVADALEAKVEATNSEYGSWASDSRSQTNFVKTSETLNLKQTQFQANVLSTALLTEGERLGLGAEVCQDIAVLLSGPRVKTLSWDMDRELLLENCRIYMERTHGGTRALTTELKYLNLDPKHFQHLPEEDDDDTDIYYGIEKGYEHLVEFQEPEEIWQDADPERTETASSWESDNSPTVRRKKKVKKVVMSSEEESDPLSLVAEAKRVEGKKERPHSKERNKEDKRNKSQEKIDKPKKEHSRERRKETHKKDKKKEKKERKKRKKNDNKEEPKPTLESWKMANIGSLSSLIGMKIANMKKNIPNDATKAALSITDSDYTSQGKISLNSLNSEGNDSNVLFDGLYSMDELKSPERSSHATHQTYNDRSSVSAMPDEAGHKQRYNVDLLNDSLNRVPTIPDCLSYVPNTTTVSDEVKLGISKLIHNRRQRHVLEYTLKESTRAVPSPSLMQMHQHNGNWNSMVKQTNKSPKAIIKQEMTFQSQISPKVVTIPEIPKMYIDKNQVNRMNNEPKNEVKDLSFNKVSKNIRSPAASGSTNISITNNTVHPTNMSNFDKIKDINMHPNASIIQKQENAFTEVGKKGDQTTHVLYPSILPNAAVMLAKYDTPSQQRFQDFLKDLQESINAGTGEEKAKIFHSPQPTSSKKEIKPMSRVTPVMVNTKAEIKFSPQCAKPLVQQKKVENSLNTFSRRSYMHKNKLTDSKIKQDTNTDYQDPLQQRIGGAEIDRVLSEHKKNLQVKSDLVISRIYTPKTVDKAQISIKKGRPQESPVCKEHPVLSNLLQNQIKHVQMERQNFSPPSVPLRTSSLLEKDQEDLKLLLQQQGKLNASCMPPRNDIPNTSVHNVQLLQSSTNHNITSTNHTTPYTKIPPSNTKIATLQIKNQVPNHAVQIATVTNSIMSSNLLQNVDVKPTLQQPLNMTKLIHQYNETLDTNDYSIQPQQDQVIVNACEDKSMTNEDTQTDWESVMNAILAHKTPSRGPNALEMALNKDSYKGSDTNLRNQRIVRIKSTSELNLVDKTTSNAKYHDEDFLESKTNVAPNTYGSNRNQNNVIHRDKGLINSKTKLAHDTCRNLNLSNDMKQHDKGLPKSKTKSSHDLRRNLDVSNDIKHHDKGLLKSKTKTVFDTSCYNLKVSNDMKHPDKSSKSKMKPAVDTSSSYLNVSDDIKHHDKSLVKSKINLGHDTPRSNLNIHQHEPDNLILTCKSKSSEILRVTKQLNTHACTSTSNIVKAENLEASKKISKKSNQIDGTAKLSSKIPNNQYAPDNRKRQFTCSVAKEDDPFISGIQNSDYDLLEELMDDDLRQEIGELSSDEETYRSSLESQKGIKTSVTVKSGSNVVNKSYHTTLIEDKIRALDTMHVTNAQQKSLVTIQKSAIQTPSTKNRNSNDIVTEPAMEIKAHSASTIEPRSKDVKNSDTLLSKPCIRPPNVIRNLPSKIVLTPKNDTKQQSNATNSTTNVCKSVVTDPSKVFVTAVPKQTNLQNVVIIGSELIYDPYTSFQAPVQPSVNSIAQNTYVAYSKAPNMTLFHTSQFAAPAVNPLIIGNAFTMPIAPNIPSTIASPIINNTVQSTQPHVAAHNIKVQDNIIKVQDNIIKVQDNIIKVQDNLQSEINNINVKKPLKPTIEQYLDDNYTKMENKVQLYVNSNKNSERKVLSLVQEKQNLTAEKSDTKNHRPLIENDAKKETLKDQERLKEKRMAIMNREICHRCDNKPIPLTYEPLKPQAPCVLDQSVMNQINNTATQDINKINPKLDITQSDTDIPNKEIIISANLDGNENCKENESTSIPCRRILLRSSNKLKPKVNPPPEVSKNHVVRKTKVRLKEESPKKLDIPVENKCEGLNSEIASAVTAEKLDIPVETSCEGINSEVASVVTRKRTSKRAFTKKLPKVKDVEKKVVKSRCKRSKIPGKNKRQSKLQNGCKIPKIESPGVKLIDVEDELPGSKILKSTSQTILTDNIIEEKPCKTIFTIRDKQESKEPKICLQKILTVNGTEAVAMSDINNHQPMILNDGKHVLYTNSHQIIPVALAKPDDAISKAHKTAPIKQDKANNTQTHIAEENKGIIELTQGEKTTQYKEITLIKTVQNKPEIEIAVDVKSSKKMETRQSLKHTGSDYYENSSGNNSSNNKGIIEPTQGEKTTQCKEVTLIKTVQNKPEIEFAVDVKSSKKMETRQSLKHTGSDYYENSSGNNSSNNKGIIEPTQGEKTTQYKEITLIKTVQNKPEIEIAVDVKSSKKMETRQSLKHTGSDYYENSSGNNSSNNKGIIEPTQGGKTTQYKEITLIKTVQNKPEIEIAVDVKSSKTMETRQSLKHTGSDYYENSSGNNSSNNSNRLCNDSNILNSIHTNTVSINNIDKDIISTSDKIIDTLSVTDRRNNSNENRKQEKIMGPRQVLNPTLYKSQQTLPVPANSFVEISDKKSTTITTEDVNAANNRGNIDNIPQSFKDSIIIESLPKDVTNDPLKKCVRIKLPSGRAFKATVHGSTPVNFDSLFADPAIKSILLNTLNYKKKYTLNIKQVTTSDKQNPHKILETRFEDLKIRTKYRSGEIETVNLLSDDEDEDLYQTFKTEFGSYKILAMDRDIFTQHQNQLYKKCSVKLIHEILAQGNGSEEKVDISSIDNTEDSKLDFIPKCNCEPSLTVNDSTENNHDQFDGKIDKRVNNTENTITEKTCKDITTDSVSNGNNIQIQDIIEIDDSSNDSLDLTSYVNQPIEIFPKNPAPECEATIHQLKCLLLKDLGVEAGLKGTLINIPSTVSTDNNETTEQQRSSYPVGAGECVVKITKCDDLVKKYDEIIKRKCFIELVRCDLIQNTSLSMKQTESGRERQCAAGSTTLDAVEQEKIEIDVENMITSPNITTLSRSGSYSILDDFSLFDDVDANIESENECDRTSPVMDVFEIIVALCNKSLKVSKIREDNIKLTTSTDLHISCDSEWHISKRRLNQYHKTLINEQMNSRRKIMSDEDNLRLEDLDCITIINDQNKILSTNLEFNMSCDSEWMLPKRSISQNYKTNEEMYTQNKIMTGIDNQISKYVSNIIVSNMTKQNLRLSTNPELNMSCDSEWLASKRSVSQNHKTIINTVTLTQNKMTIDEHNLFSNEVSNMIKNTFIKEEDLRLSTSKEFNISCEAEWLISKCKMSQYHKIMTTGTTLTQNKIIYYEDNPLSKEVSNNINTDIKIIQQNIRLSSSSEFNISCVSEWFISKRKLSKNYKTVMNETTQNKITTDVDNLLSKDTITTCSNYISNNVIVAELSPLKLCVPTLLTTISKFLHDNPSLIHKLKPSHKRKITNDCSTVAHKMSKTNFNTSKNENMYKISLGKTSSIQSIQPTNEKADTDEKLEAKEFCLRHDDSIHVKINMDVLASGLVCPEFVQNQKDNNGENVNKFKAVQNFQEDNSEMHDTNNAVESDLLTLLEEVGGKIDDRQAGSSTTESLKYILNQRYDKESMSDYLCEGPENETNQNSEGHYVTTQKIDPYKINIEVASADDLEDLKRATQRTVNADKNTDMNIDNSHEERHKCTTLFDHAYLMNCELECQNINNTISEDSSIDVMSKDSSTSDKDSVVKNRIIYEDVNTQRTNATINIQNNLTSEYEVVISKCGAEDKDRKRSDEHLENVKKIHDAQNEKGSSNTQEISYCNQSKKCYTNEESERNEIICTEDMIISKNSVGKISNKDAQLAKDKPGISVDEILADDTVSKSLHDHSAVDTEEYRFVAKTKPECNKPKIDESPNANEDNISEDTNSMGLHDDSRNYKDLEEIEKSRRSKNNIECSVDNVTTSILPSSPVTKFMHISKDVSGIYLKSFLLKTGDNKNLHNNSKNIKNQEEIGIIQNCDPNMQFLDKELEKISEKYDKLTENIIQTNQEKLLLDDKDNTNVALKQVLGIKYDGESLSERTQNRKDLKETLKSSSKIKNYTDFYIDMKIGDRKLDDNEIKNEKKILTDDNMAYMNILENSSEDKQVTLIYKDDSGIVLKGIEYEDPEMGTCYMFPLIQGKFENGENYNINTDQAAEDISEIDKDNTIQDETYFKVMVPKITYSKSSMDRSVRIQHSKNIGRRSKRNLKRKIDMTDVKIAEKRYRKGKNIDHPKSTTAVINDTMYCKEYRRLFEYCSSLKFSYSRPFHKEHIDVQDILTAWPIKGPCPETKNDIEIDENLFIDIEHINKLKVVQDPMLKTLAEELIVEYKEPLLSRDINETNFSMGFGERSGRVIQNLEDGGDISSFSAATLSDVKQTQPFLLSEKYNVCIKEQRIENRKNDQMKAIKRYFNNIYLKDKVRSFFKKTTIELKNDWIKDQGKKYKDRDDTTKFPFGLNLPDFIEPAPIKAILQVVQVGQLPVSAAAQNPVTCDPRVTQVSDASPSQCSAENSPHDDSQSPVQNEYTELTTADLRIPMQEYAHHNQIINMESRESINDENIPIETEIKSEVKIELIEEVPEEKDDQNESLEFNEQQPLTNNKIVDNIDYSYDTNNTNTSSESDSNIQLMFSSAERQSIPDSFSQQEQQNDSSEKNDQIAHAMNAAGITTSAESLSNARAQALVNMLSQKIRQGAVGTNQTTANNYTKATSINAMALQQALAQILPPPLNQSNTENNQQTTSNPVPPQVLHIVQGKTATGNQITLVDNTQQSVINTPNSASVLHIVQNKGTSSGPTSNGTPAQHSNSFGGLSLVDTGLQQGGNQLLHIVNTGNQKSNHTGQLLKRVNLLTNLTNVQGSNEQKMVQFVCKSADGKAIQLNAPHQRSMVLRLQPIESQNIPTTPKSIDSQDLSPTSNSAPSKEILASQQEIKSRSVYEENYAKFIQNSSTKTSVSEKSTSLPKFNQAFGKQVFQDGNQKQNEMNNGNSHLPSANANPEHTECQSTDNSISLDHISQISSPPLILRKSSAQSSQSQPNLVQQIKQTIAPMNIQTMHGGVIYTRQIPVNIGGGQTINLITVPSTELIDDSTQKQQSDVKFVNQNEIEPSIIKIVPQSQSAPNAEVSAEDNNSQVTNDNTHTTHPQPILTQMRIKLPMLSKNPQMVSGARVVRPSFFQIQRNVIGGANQPVYQQLVLTAAPPLGQQTIRLPQTQTSRQIKVPSESQSSNESQMSSSTLEQLREFDLVLEQVKERSTVQPNATSNRAFSKLHTSSTDATDGATSVISTPTETTQQVLYSIGNNQPLNVAYVNRKATVSTPTTSTYVRSPDSSGIADSPSSSMHVQIPHTVTTESSSDTPHSKAAKVGSKSKSRPKASSNPPNTMKINTVPPKPSTQKPLEDEQTTQRILYILAEYKEQVENSPDKDKPAPRRRANAPSNPGSSKRKKSSSASRRPGARDMSPIHGEDTCRTMGSEDSSCGTSQGDCNESCIDSHSPQDSPQKVVRRLTFEQETPIVQPRPLPQRNVIVADGQTITVARGSAGKPTTAVLMPANYILPVSMVKGGQQIAIVTNRGPKLLTVGGEGGTTNALLLQRLIGPAGLKPVLTRPGVRHVRLPTAALHNLQAFNLATATTVQPPDSTASHASAPAPPDLIDTRASGSPWADRDDMKPERGSSPEDSEPWNLASSADTHDYTYEETVRTDNMNRTVLDPIQDRYSPDMEAQRIFDKMFDVESKKSYMVNSPRCGYDIDASDCDDKAYHQVVHKKDGHRQHRLTHVSAAALRHKYAILEHELRLQKSLSEECEDLGVDSPSAAELFPEAELLFATSPAHDHTQEQGHHSHTPQPIVMSGSGSGISQPDMDDQIATDQLLTRDHIPDDRQDLSLGLEDVGIVTVSEDGMQATIALDQEEFARSHPNTTFHSEPDVGVVQPFTIAGLKTRHITSIFHANRAPGTVLMTAPQTTVISQATAEPHVQNAVKYSDIDNMINSIPAHSNNVNLSSVLVKDDGLTRFDSILTDSRELHLSNTASAVIHSSGNATQVIRRVCYDDDKRERDTRFLMDEPEGLIAGNDAKMVAEDSSRDATLGSMTGDVDDDRSSPERHAELFWESNSASERSDGRRPLDFSSDSDKCCKSPSFDETNSTDSSGVGTHMRLDSVIKEARGIDRSASAGSSADDAHPPLRTYPPKRLYQPLEVEMERSLSGKTRAGERSPDVRRRASGRGVVKRGCHCCNGSPAPLRPKKSRQKKPTMDFTANN